MTKSSLKDNSQNRESEMFEHKAAQHVNIGETPDEIFHISVFTYVLDTVIHTIENRFVKHKKLYLNL